MTVELTSADFTRYAEQCDREADERDDWIADRLADCDPCEGCEEETARGCAWCALAIEDEEE
jgi:hypothetical protein